MPEPSGKLTFVAAGKACRFPPDKAPLVVTVSAAFALDQRARRGVRWLVEGLGIGGSRLGRPQALSLPKRLWPCGGVFGVRARNK